MRLGVIARSENRGLGIQTLEVCRAMNPVRVIIVDMGPLAGHFASHREWFDRWDTHVVRHDEMHDPSVIGPLVRDLSVVYFAETCYRWEFCDIARSQHCATVCHLNPEFFAHARDDNFPRPSRFWLPSTWMRHDPRIPADAEYVPMPVPTDRWPEPFPEHYDGSRPLRVLHVGGHQAMGDRNGTRSLLAALRHVTRPVEVTVTTQDRHLPTPQRIPRNVTYRTSAGVRDYWNLYRGFDVLVMPRRYGGLCLPAIEAAGAGLAVVLNDCPPNEDYPAMRVKCHRAVDIDMKIGMVETYTADAPSLAATLDHLADNPSDVLQLQRMSRIYAQDMSWDQWKQNWHKRFDALIP